ncbi:MAG: hypothetical protein RI922_99 [Bacteroidota bacterium]|jgi:putative Ca2+/H+ antiporter (TMEM165/GDT1 family)
MRKFVLIYVILAAAFAIITTILQIEPALTVISWVMESDGRFMVVLPLAILFIAALIPMFIIVAIFNIINAKKQDTQPELLDQTSIIVRRDKSLYGGVFAMDILIDQKKMATVTLGKSRQILLPMGEYDLSIKAMGKACEPVKISLNENKALEFQVGFKLGGTMQSIYIEQITG